MRRTTAGLIFSSLAVAGLAAPLDGCALATTHGQAAAYRNLSRMPPGNDRAIALTAYATEYPSGGWIDEVQAERRRDEEQIWTENQNRREGIEFYLAAYPDGQYVERAQQRLAGFNITRDRAEQVADRTHEAQAQTAEEQAQYRREWVTRAAQFWARTLVGIRNYGSPISQVARANREFSQAFGQAPAPACTATSCIKHYRAQYAIPVRGGNRLEREMHVFLRLRLDRGRVERAEVLFPNKGFSRWYELENRTVVTDEDPSQRQAAIEWALARLEPVIMQAAAGSHSIDIIPDPIDPIAEAAPTTGEEPDTATDINVAPAPATDPAAPTAAPTGGETDEENRSIDELMAGAAGGSTEATPTETPTEDVAGATLVLPIGLRALQLRNVRVAVFAAGDEDYGDAFDGFYIERARD